MQLLVFQFLPLYDTQTRCAEESAEEGAGACAEYPDGFSCGAYSYHARAEFIGYDDTTDAGQTTASLEDSESE